MIDDAGQLVENEDMIGTLIETNDRIIAALESYDQLSSASLTSQDVEAVQNKLATANISDVSGSEIGKLQEKQRAAVQRSIGRASSQNLNGKSRSTALSDEEEEYSPGGSRMSSVHPDLQDLSFGALGADQRYDPYLRLETEEAIR